MDFLVYVICFIVFMMAATQYIDSYYITKLKLRYLIAVCIIIPATTCFVAIKSATVTEEKFYSISSYGGINYDEPADLLIKTTTYPKWSVLTNDIFFTQIPKGKN